MEKKLLWPHDVAIGAGVSAQSVRRYSDAGLVPYFRDAAGRRRYRPEAIEILREKLGLTDKHEAAGKISD